MNKKPRHCEERSNLVSRESNLNEVDCFVPPNDVLCKFSLVFLIVLTLFSCKKDKPETKTDTIIQNFGNGVYIVNEGGFGYGNGSVSYYSPSDCTITLDLFQTQNSKPLGDVCQSLTFFNQKGYVVVNNSQKIEVVKQSDFTSLATISGFTSPRYFLPVSNNKAYVTDLYANKIAVVNLSNNSISNYINCKTWTEELVLSYGKAFVCTPKSDKIYVIETTTDLLIDSIVVSYGSSSIKEDKNGKLWVLCRGDSDKNIKGALFQINPLNHIVEQSIAFPDAKNSPSNLQFNGTNDTLYYLNQGVFRMSILDISLPNTAIIAENGKNFYGLGIHPTTSEIYVSDAVDYVQKSLILRYSSNGVLKTSFNAGIISGNFVF